MLRRLSMALLLVPFIVATLTGQEKKLNLDPIDVNIPHISTDKSVKYIEREGLDNQWPPL